MKTIRYWGSTVLDLGIQELVDVLAIRWEIETFFEYGQDLLGSDYYQLMTAQAILRFWTLIACLISFLEEQGAEETDQNLTCGDIRQRIQHVHCLNLLNWLEKRFREGCSIEQISSQSALCSS